MGGAELGTDFKVDLEGPDSLGTCTFGAVTGGWWFEELVVELTEGGAELGTDFEVDVEDPASGTFSAVTGGWRLN